MEYKITQTMGTKHKETFAFSLYSVANLLPYKGVSSSLIYSKATTQHSMDYIYTILLMFGWIE